MIRYSEGVEYLYKENSFDFRNMEGLVKFTDTVLPSRLKLVKDIQTYYMPLPRYFSLPPLSKIFLGLGRSGSDRSGSDRSGH